MDLDDVVQPALLGDDDAPGKSARAAHDRIDRLILGRAGAARKRVNRLLGDMAEPGVTTPFQIVPETPAEREAVVQAAAVRGRIAAFLAAS
jgi:hypothetical protein